MIFDWSFLRRVEPFQKRHFNLTHKGTQVLIHKTWDIRLAWILRRIFSRAHTNEQRYEGNIVPQLRDNQSDTWKGSLGSSNPAAATRLCVHVFGLHVGPTNRWRRRVESVGESRCKAGHDFILTLTRERCYSATYVTYVSPFSSSFIRESWFSTTLVLHDIRRSLFIIVRLAASAWIENFLTVTNVRSTWYRLSNMTVYSFHTLSTIF